MSQKGSTLSLYPSSVTCYNSTAAAATIINNNNNNIMNHHSSSDDDDDDHDPSSKNGGGGGGKSRRELPSGAVATLKAWLLAPEHFTHPYPTPQDQVMLMQKTGIDKKQLKNWFTNARRRIWKPMLKKQLEAGKLAAGVSVSMTAASTSGGGGTVGGGENLMPDLTGSFHQQQQQQQYQQQQQQQNPPPEPRQEMYSNFQQAQSQQHSVIDPSSSYEQQQQQQYQQQQQQQQGQFLQEIGQVHHQPVYDQYGNLIFDASASYQQTYPYQQDNQSSSNINNSSSINSNNNNNTSMNSSDNITNFPLSNSIGSLPPMTPGSSMGGGGASTSSFGNNMVKTDSHAVLMELFARDQDLVRQAASKGGVAGIAVGAGGSIHVGQQQQQQGMTNMVSNVLSSASSPPGNVRWAAGSVGGGSGPVLQKQHSVTFEGVPSLSSWPHFSSVSSLNNLGGLQGVKSITNLSAADLSSQGNLNKMGNLAHVKSIENMGRFDSFAFLEVFFDDKSGLNSSTHSSNGLRGVKRERDDDDAIGLSLDGDDGTSPGQFNNSSNKAPGTDPASESGGQDHVPLSYESTDRFDGSEMDGGTLKRAYDDALAARGLIAVRRSCEKLTDLALPAKMQRTLSQEYIRQHNQGQHMGDFFSTNNSAYAPNSNRNNNNINVNNYSPHLVSSDGDGNENINTSSVEVPSSTTCTLCTLVNVDTQLRPCGHMFHGRCLKPSLQNTMGPPKCPICSTSMQSAILAVPTAATECGGGAVTIA